MTSIFDLRRELEEEKNKTKSYQEIQDVGREREELKRKIAEERRKRKPVDTTGDIKRGVGKVVKKSKPFLKKTKEAIGKMQEEQYRRDNEKNEKSRRGLGLFG